MKKCDIVCPSMTKKEVLQIMKEKQIKNPNLVEAMNVMLKEDTDKNRSNMAEALLESLLIAPVDKEKVLLEKKGPSTRMRLKEILNTKGEKYAMAFTDLDEYAKWNEDGNSTEALSVTMDDLGNILLRTPNEYKGFVINPYGENVSISKQLLLSLLKQRDIQKMKKRGN